MDNRVIDIPSMVKARSQITDFVIALLGTMPQSRNVYANREIEDIVDLCMHELSDNDYISRRGVAEIVRDYTENACISHWDDITGWATIYRQSKD